MFSPRSAFALVLALPVIALTGCALQNGSQIAPAVLTQKISGRAHGGQQPVTNSTVTVYSIGTGGYGSPAIPLATTTTDGTGAFQMPAYICPQANTPVYIVASGGNPGLAPGTNNAALTLAAALGQCGAAQSLTVNIDEVTTVAAAYSMAQFAAPNTTGDFGGPSSTSGSTITYSLGLSNAILNTAPALANIATGAPQTSSATTIVQADRLNTLANILAACVNSDGTGTPCTNLFAATTPPNNTAPANTLAAAVNMALYPYQNTAALFALVSPTAPFVGLSTAPADLTLSLAYTAPAGSSAVPTTDVFSNLAIDATGNLWLPNGDRGVLQFTPSTGAFAGPFNFPGAGTLSTSQVAIDLNNTVWLPAHNGFSLGSTSTTSPQDLTIHDSAVSLNGNSTPTQPLTVAIDANGNLSYGFFFYIANGYGVASLSGGTTSFLTHLAAAPASQNQDLGDTGFLTQPSASTVNEEFVSAAGLQRTSNTDASTRIGQITTAQNYDSIFPLFDTSQICHYDGTCGLGGFAGLNQPLGLATDGAGNQWAVNTGNNSVSTFIVGATATSDLVIAPSGYVLGPTLMPAPSAVAIDQSGNVWISNPYVTPAVLTEIVGSAGPTIQPIAAQYQAATGFRVGSPPSN